MHFKKLLISIILPLCILCTACAASYSAEPEASSVETELSSVTETTTEATAAETTTTTAETTTAEETDTEEIEAEKETTYEHLGITDGVLKYEDVRGYFFRTEFHSDWPQNDYDQNAFKMVDGRMTYDSDKYTYRLGIDVYNEYGVIDWEAVKKDGYEFAIIRAGYRGYNYPSLVRDENLFSYMHGALNAGFDLGVYFFSQAITEEEAVEEAEFVIEQLEGQSCTPENLVMGVTYDPEYIGNWSARSTDLTGEQITKNARAFCDRITKEGYKALIYSNMVWEDRNFDLSELSDIDIWYADYTAYPQSPYHFTLWQYGHGTADGVKGDVDVNIELIPVSEESGDDTDTETTTEDRSASEETSKSS